MLRRLVDLFGVCAFGFVCGFLLLGLIWLSVGGLCWCLEFCDVRFFLIVFRCRLFWF